ncbi:MAG: hypothetical protein A2Y33_09390 [Spirochaetes bacterium GWF1_51_8]|nr:MAG: hypothetical protein A2Y33_09390 [Spirochaetes bacterium GWF1_51_8]
MEEKERVFHLPSIVTGYLFIGFAAFLLLSLASFTPNDSAFFVSKVNRPVENIAGDIGASVSSFFVITYGRVAGFLVDFAILVIGLNILIRAKTGRILLKASLFTIASISLSALTALLFGNLSFIDKGMLGIGLMNSLSEIIHPYVLIGIFSLMFLLSLSGTMKLFRFAAFFFARTIGQIALAPFHLFGLIIRGEKRGEAETDVLIDPHAIHPKVYRQGEKPSADLEDIFESAPAPRMPEPDFLRPPAANDSGIVKPDGANLPSFLSNPREKERILLGIGRKFDSLLFDEGKAPVKETGPDIESVPAMIDEPHRPAAVEIPPDEPPFTPDHKAEPVPETLPPLDTENAEDIVGEADYHEFKKQKKPKTVSLKDIYDDETEPFLFPESSILDQSLETHSYEDDQREVKEVSGIIESTFRSFKIDIRVTGYTRGPVITRYEMVPPVGLKLRNIVTLQDDIALNLGATNIRIVAPIGNRSIIGVEVPNKYRRNIVLRNIIESGEFRDNDAILPLILGMDITGNIIVEDLIDMPHLLIAGTTGSGKSVYVSSLIAGLVFKRRENELKFIMIDPKMVELELFGGIPHLLAPVITQPEEALLALEWAVSEMDRRYKVLSEMNVRNISDYNIQAKKINKTRKKDGEEPMEELPYIVIVIDEFADLMLRSPKETEKVISRIAAMARAVGIHLVVATQRPSVDVVTGLIKANFPSRIAFRVSTQTDARTILDRSGAEKLLGKGDMLFLTPAFNDMFRIQAPYVSNQDIKRISTELKRNGSADYKIDFEELMTRTHDEHLAHEADFKDDPLFGEALKLAVEYGEISASFIQRKFRVGYNRASRIMEAMDGMGILAAAKSSGKPREVLIKQEDLVHYL